MPQGGAPWSRRLRREEPIPLELLPEPRRKRAIPQKPGEVAGRPRQDARRWGAGCSASSQRIAEKGSGLLQHAGQPGGERLVGPHQMEPEGRMAGEPALDLRVLMHGAGICEDLDGQTRWDPCRDLPEEV